MKQVDIQIIDFIDYFREVIDSQLYEDSNISSIKVIMPAAYKFSDSFSRDFVDCLYTYFESNA